MKKLAAFSVLLFISTLMLSATPVFISGTVSDENGKALPGVSVTVKNTSSGTITDIEGHYTMEINGPQDILVFACVGYETKEIKVSGRKVLNVQLIPVFFELEEVVVRKTLKSKTVPLSPSYRTVQTGNVSSFVQPFNTESYSTIHENGYKDVFHNPLSTFSIDVDRASYSNVRRFLNMGQIPPKDVVRIEEMINYFSYDYPEPEDEHPFSVTTELSVCPWNNDHHLLHVGLKGMEMAKEKLPASNLVFLLDVSGSMNAANKLPLLKTSFELLVKQLREKDRVAIVVYAGAAGLVLESTPGNKEDEILEAIQRLNAGGSTAGGAGLRLAYKVAAENFIEGGNNRIILATDGDFNIGSSSNAEMERMIEKEREKGIYMTVLGFGMGNYKDDKMEIIADKGNGNYAYIDNIQEARKFLISEFAGSMYTIAKDVKFQLEFNPQRVKAYRLIGYENRLLNDEDFNDDKKDAGEMGAGHTVTALYELIPAGSEEEIKDIDELKYQSRPERSKVNPDMNAELLTIKLRYKNPDEFKSILIEEAVQGKVADIEEVSDNFRFSAAVAGFGMLLRNSEYKGNLPVDDVLSLARTGRGEDEEGNRGEFIKLVKTADALSAFTASKD